MHTRKEVIHAIGRLSPDQRAQMLLYLLGDDWAALDVIDGRKWTYQEFVPWPPSRGLPETARSAHDIPGIPEGEGLA